MPRPRLLIVEDDLATRDVLRRMFRRMGWDVFSSVTVAGGLFLLDARPDCAILDLNLPDGDGSAVLAAIRDGGLAVKVVVASGTGDGEHLARVERLRPEGLLPKPTDASEILRAFGMD